MQTKEERAVTSHLYYLENKERLNASSKSYKQEHRDELQVYHKVYNDAHKDYRAAVEVMRKYHLTMDAYNALIAKGCWCGSMEDVCIDHDHSCCPGEYTCGKCIRGVMCRQHNRGEGFFPTIDEIRGLLVYRLQYEETNDLGSDDE